MLCPYWYFLNKNFSYGPFSYDGCFNTAQKSNNFKNIAIVHVKKRIYQAKKLIKNSNLIDKKDI